MVVKIKLSGYKKLYNYFFPSMKRIMHEMYTEKYMTYILTECLFWLFQRSPTDIKSIVC